MATALATVQKHPDLEAQVGGISMPLTFLYSSDIAPEWDATDRDTYLRNFWRGYGNDMLQGVLAVAVAKVQTQNWELEGPEKLAEFYHTVIRDEADFNKGYSYMVARGLIDYYTQNNGWFLERRRAGPTDFDGPMLGISHLDSGRMRATGNMDFPYTYQDIFGEYHLMHRSQYIRIVDMPTPVTSMYGDELGFCALSRALSTAMILTMLVAMKREKLADLPPSAMAIFNNINRKQFEQALTLKSIQEDMANDIIWRQLLPLFGIDAAHPASVQFISLREVWEGFDDMTAMNIAAYSFAAAWRIDPREFWPVSQGPLGTGKEAEVQHQKAKAKSTGLIFTDMERAFNADQSLPKGLTFRFKIQDIEEEELLANIHSTQIGNIKSMQEAGAGLTAEEVRYLLATQYKILPQTMTEVPEEGADALMHTDVYMDDVERQTKSYGGWWFGPTVRIDDFGTKELVGQSMVERFKELPLDVLFLGGKGDPVPTPSLEQPVVHVEIVKEVVDVDLLTKVKDQFVCCPDHAFNLFPEIVDGLHAAGLIGTDHVYASNLLTEGHINGVVLAAKKAILMGGDVLGFTARGLVDQIGSADMVLGAKEAGALVSINKKLALLGPITARQIRKASERLREAMSPTRRVQLLKDIPDEVWNEAAAADELDDQEA